MVVKIAMSQHNAATRLLVTLITHIVVNLLFCNNSRPISEQLYQAAPGHMGFWHIRSCGRGPEQHLFIMS